MGSLGEVTPLRDGIAKPFGGSSICRRVQIGGDDRYAVFAQSCNGGRPDQAACTGHEYSLWHPALLFFSASPHDSHPGMRAGSVTGVVFTSASSTQAGMSRLYRSVAMCTNGNGGLSGLSVRANGSCLLCPLSVEITQLLGDEREADDRGDHPREVLVDQDD